MRLLYVWQASIGPVYIAQSPDGRFHPVITGESVGNYHTATMAAAALARGHTCGARELIDTAALGIPADLSAWGSWGQGGLPCQM